MKLTPGKRKGMEAVSDSRGIIAAAAMDQRGSLKSAIDAAPFSDSVKPALAPLMKRLGGAAEAVNASAEEADFSVAQLATRLAAMKAADGPHKALTDEMEALKTAGLGKAFEKVQKLAQLANGK